MLDLKYALIIEATEDPTFFGFYSPDLEGFTGVGHSTEGYIYQARWGMEEHIAPLQEMGMPVPEPSPAPQIIVENEQQIEAAPVAA
ncbi:MAG: type II toxin-antitoxin system HicB family antitoxin [Anaerolineae bacterium]|jgi:predicted RNase H-like HicB family nuclease